MDAFSQGGGKEVNTEGKGKKRKKIVLRKLEKS